MKLRSILMAALASTTIFGMPLASAGVDVCVAIECAHLDTTTITQTQTCGGSGNIFVTNGNNNTYNVCTQNQTGGPSPVTTDLSG